MSLESESAFFDQNLSLIRIAHYLLFLENDSLILSYRSKKKSSKKIITYSESFFDSNTMISQQQQIP